MNKKLAIQCANYKQDVIRVFSSKVKSQALLDDLFQESLIRILLSKTIKYETDSKLKSYFLGTFNSTLIDYTRKAKILTTELNGREHAEDNTDTYKKIKLEEDIKHILNEIQSYPETDKLIIQCRLKGKKLREISEEHNISMNKVKNKFYRSIRMLRESYT